MKCPDCQICVGNGNCAPDKDAEDEPCVDGTGSGTGICNDRGQCYVETPLKLVDFVTLEVGMQENHLEDQNADLSFAGMSATNQPWHFIPLNFDITSHPDFPIVNVDPFVIV